MRAVLLAAGLGGRLLHHTASIPKPLVPVFGRPLVSYTLDALAEAGVRDLVVVTGYREAELRATLNAISPLPLSYRHNDRYHCGASYSLAAAREACGDEPFLLVMSDHMVDPVLLQRLMSHDPLDGAVIAADSTPRDSAYVDEATRLLVDEDGRVLAIGKLIPRWNALDTGAFHCGPGVWEALNAAPEGCYLSDVFSVLACERRLRSADVSGCFWYDVDTPEDRAIAEELLQCRSAVAPS